MPAIKVQWELCAFKPPSVWPLVKKSATETTRLNLSAIERCVYVVRIAHTYCIEYRLRASPTLYIGRGSFQQRITAHINWINELALLLRDLEIQVWFFTPRVKRNANAYKTVEADLIEEFVKENGSVPWFNRNRPWPVYNHSYEPILKFRHAVLQGRGSHFPWSIRPNGNDEMRSLFEKNFDAQPRET
jgi:hypothetical protein